MTNSTLSKAYSTQLREFTLMQYRLNHPYCKVLLSLDNDEEASHLYRVTLIGADGEVVRVDEIHNPRMTEEEGFTFEAKTVFHIGHYDLAKETVTTFLKDKLSLTYKEFSLQFGPPTDASNGKAVLYINFDDIYMSCEFHSYIVEVAEQGMEYSERVGHLSNFKFLGMNREDYNPKETIDWAYALSSNKYTYEPEGIKVMNVWGLRQVEEITITNDEYGTLNTLDMTKVDKELFHAIATVFKIDGAFYFFYGQ